MNLEELDNLVRGRISGPFLHHPYYGYIRRPNGLWARDRDLMDWIIDFSFAYRFTGSRMWSMRDYYDDLQFLVVKSHEREGFP